MTMTNYNGVPIEYHPNWVADPDQVFKVLREELTWIRHDKVPRSEYYSNDVSTPYTYGVKDFARTYHPQPWHADMEMLRANLEQAQHGPYEVCFLNMYEDGSDQLNYHADDSPEMDDNRSIAIISLGAEREIWFRPQESKEPVTKLRLGHGSLCIMKPGMQDQYFHRIPKSDRHNCGPRISLTYRGYVDPNALTGV
jgi:alkylated DNA repair dioxygenase AlkB